MTEPEPLHALKADATTGPEGARVPLVTDEGEGILTVPPSGKWKTKATSALAAGDFDTWVAKTLSEADQDTWNDLDPTVDDAQSFFKAWSKASGETLGKSRRSSRS